MGGHVLDPAPGLYRNVLVFDFKSLYPGIIRTFQIDPLGQVLDESEAAGILGVSRAAATRDWRMARAWLAHRLRDEEDPG